MRVEEVMQARGPQRGRKGRGVLAGLALAVALGPATLAAQEPAFTWDSSDPRIGLRPGITDAGEASWNLRLLANVPRPGGFYNPASHGDGDFSNTDLAFSGEVAFVGNYHGFQAWDISDPKNPQLRVSVICPGGQGDVSAYGNLVFMSVEQPRGRQDCGIGGVQEQVSEERFRGVRIFDVSDLANPRQVSLVQTCRGSHTHTLVTDPRDPKHVYVYVSGTSGVRSAEELPGCSAAEPDEDPDTSLFRIEVIRVPLSAPQDARVVAEPRLFADAEGNVAGLWQGGDHGPGTQESRRTHQCHDITAYPELGLAAGACSGNGILLDIRDPANPVRIHEVIDPNFAYWHSATFNNDGTSVIFTDEWGGGRGARCRATDPPTWGANALFHLRNGELELAGYYKLPVPQTEMENCVAHNGSLVPVPGRDIKVQAWYQGGISVFDFTDPANPFEIAFFDRGPLSDTELFTGGYWSSYWHNGYVYGAEITRGLDVLELVPNEHLTRDELEAAKLVRFGEFNPQMQPRIVWPAAFPVSRAYLDQLDRNGALAADTRSSVRAALDRAERSAGAAEVAELQRLGRQLDGLSGSSQDPVRVRALATSLRDLAASLR